MRDEDAGDSESPAKSLAIKSETEKAMDRNDIVNLLLEAARSVVENRFGALAPSLWSGLEPNLRAAATNLVEQAVRNAATPPPAQSDDRERLRDAFLASYTQQLRRAAREGKVAWPESRAEEVARKMIAAIEKGQANWSPTLAKAAKDVGIKPNMTAVREALYGPSLAKRTGPESEKEARKPDVSVAQAARRDALLDARVDHNGVTKTWRQLVEEGIRRGGELGVAFRTNPDLTRTAFNRMGNAEQDAWEKKQKEKGLKPVFRVGTDEEGTFVEVNKTVFEYAMGLSQKPISVSYDFGFLDGTAKAAAREATRREHERLLRAVEEHNEARSERPAAYRYGAANRPPNFATVPKGYVRIESPPKNPNGQGVEPGARHGVLVYDRPLTPDEIRSYQLVPYLPSEDVVRQALTLADEYGQEYADLLRDSEEHEVNGLVRQWLGRVNEGNYFTNASDKEIGNQIVEAILQKYQEEPPAAPKFQPGDKVEDENGKIWEIESRGLYDDFLKQHKYQARPESGGMRQWINEEGRKLVKTASTVAPAPAPVPAPAPAPPAPSATNASRRAEEWKALEKSEEWQGKRTPERIADFARRHPDFAPIAVENEKTLATETRPFPYFGLSGGYKEITPIVRRGSAFVSKTKDGKFDVINALSSVVLGRFDLFANAQNFLEKLPDAFVTSSPSAGSYAQSVREKDALLSREGGKKVYEPG